MLLAALVERLQLRDGPHALEVLRDLGELGHQSRVELLVDVDEVVHREVGDGDVLAQEELLALQQLAHSLEFGRHPLDVFPLQIFLQVNYYNRFRIGFLISYSKLTKSGL